MTRSTLSSGNKAQATAPVLRLVEFIALAFPAGTLRATTAPVAITWGGNTYNPSPAMTDYGRVPEASDLKAHQLSLTFSGTDATLLSRILTDTYHMATVNLWVGFLDENNALVDTPYLLVENLLMSNAGIGLDKDSSVISLAVEGWELFGTRDAAVLATPEAQRLRYPGDAGQDRVALIPTEDLQWGGAFQRS